MGDALCVRVDGEAQRAGGEYATCASVISLSKQARGNGRIYHRCRPDSRGGGGIVMSEGFRVRGTWEPRK